MGRGHTFGAGQPWLVLAAVVALLVGCGGSEAEPDDAAEEEVEIVEEEPDTTDEDEVEETVETDAEADDDEPAEEPAPEEIEDPAQTDDDEVDIFALQPGDVIEGTYEFGFPESGAAFACTWLDTEQGRITLVSNIPTDEGGLLVTEPAVGVTQEGIARYQPGDSIEAEAEAEQIVVIGDLVRIEVAQALQVQDFGPGRDGCGDPEDPLVVMADAEPVE